MKDHDIQLRDNVVAKVDANTARPHADGCVGCRRDGVCIRCGKASMISTKLVDGKHVSQPGGRCISGACPTCCQKIHKHVDENPLAVAERIGPG